eukprot:GFUD01033701.1.p1 GENE.GFUD01033701.1~~GFUD01033701.1.p1  ORF type:complete len:162 (+),score=70.66 GFUD01033701.1:55-540(+)
MADSTKIMTSLSSLLSQLTSPPFSPSLLSSLANQCTLLKQYGAQLEQTNKTQLDEVQVELTRLCQDTSLGLEQRLQLLELIELRTLGWETNENMEQFYRIKFKEVGDKEVGDKEVGDTTRRAMTEETEEIVTLLSKMRTATLLSRRMLPRRWSRWARSGCS